MPPTATLRSLYRLLYAIYAWFILIFAITPVAAGCLLLPGLDRRRRLAHHGSRAVFRLIGSRIRIRGTPLESEDSAIVVANHQSYLDGIILTAVLPPQFTFLIKREMIRVPIAGFVLARLGSQFVDRASSDQRQRSARQLLAAARQGQALAVFPEGTFDGAPGLKPFRLGAFRVARIAGRPIVPIVIKGARSKLPSDSWLPRPGPLSVEFCPRLDPGDYADEAALMRATRRAMLQRLGEPDLAEEFRGPRISAHSRPPAEPSECFEPDP